MRLSPNHSGKPTLRYTGAVPVCSHLQADRPWPLAPSRWLKLLQALARSHLCLAAANSTINQDQVLADDCSACHRTAEQQGSSQGSCYRRSTRYNEMYRGSNQVPCSMLILVCTALTGWLLLTACQQNQEMQQYCCKCVSVAREVKNASAKGWQSLTSPGG